MRISYLLALLVGLIAVAGCGSSRSVTGVPEEVTREIPDGSTVVVVKSVEIPDDLYQELEKRLLSQGFELQESNRSARRLQTRFRRMPDGYALRISAEVNDLGGVSVVRLSGTFRSSSNMRAGRGTGAEFDMGRDQQQSNSQPEARDAEWSGGVARDAFGDLLRLAQQIPYESIAYEQ